MKERVLLHLFGYVSFSDSLDVPQGLTQDGVADAVGIDLPHFTQYVRPLMAEGLVRERLAHVKGTPRRRKVYDLTDAGKLSAVRLREKVKAEIVRAKDVSGTARDMKVAEILASVPKASIVDIVREHMESGVVDLQTLSAPRGPSLVEMLSEAPAVETFVGREQELALVTSDEDRQRIVVVRGIAGIGKTTFAAKACDLVRGRRNLFWHRVQPWDSFASILARVGDFLHATGEPALRAVLARGETSRAADVFRETLVGTRAFLVFDDVHHATEDAQLFFSLLKEAVAQARDVRALILTRETMPFYDRRDVSLSRLVAEIDLAGLEAEDIKRLLPEGEQVSDLVEAGRRVGGHPLFIELLRTHGMRASLAVEDVNRFIEEEVYSKLSDRERRLMKTAALYEVPVPREVLLADPTLSHDVLRSLSQRSLLRAAGAEAYEAHDTIRAFFAGVLSPAERNELSAFAANQLRRLAEQAREVGDFPACINYLSNALRLSTSTEDRAGLWEELGDANRSVGDLSATLSAYAEAMRAIGEREALVRLHRKRAQAFAFWDQWDAVSKEISAALRALDDSASIERGWLHLISAEMGYPRDEPEETREHGRAALQVFQAFGDAEGQVQALTALANIEMWTARGSLRLADEYLTSALALANRIQDAKTLKQLHEAAAWVYAHEFGDVERAMHHVEVMTRSPAIMGDPTMRQQVISQRGFLHLDWRRDLESAERDLQEAIGLARSVHDEGAVTHNEFGLAIAWFFEGRADEARPVFERTTEERLAQGYAGSAVEGFWRIAECSLWQGDADGFSQAVARLGEPRLAVGIESRRTLVGSLRAIDQLLRGDQEACDAALRELVAFAEAQIADQTALDQKDLSAEMEPPRLTYPRTLFPYVPHFFFAVALRVVGRDREASEHMARAMDLLRAKGYRARFAILPEEERRFVECLCRAIDRTGDPGGAVAFPK